jgi:membrane protein YdbS with pleckstrin-like domain
MVCGWVAVLARVRKSSISAQSVRREETMGLIILIIVLLLVIGALPTWPYSTGWGYYPSGGLGLILLILIILLLMGRL